MSYVITSKHLFPSHTSHQASQILIGGNNTTASSVQYSDGPVGQFRCDAIIRIGQDEMWQL